MPFCSKCGKQLQEGSNFCDGCGASVNINTQVNPTQETRKSSLEEMDKMINYFSKKQAQYDEYDNCVEQLSYYSNPSTVIRIDEKLPWKGPTGKPFILIAIGIMALCYVWLTLGLTFAEQDYSKIIAPIIVLIIGIVMLVSGIVIRKKYNSVYRSFNQYIKTKQISEKERLIKQYQDRCNQLSEELDTHFKNYGYCAVAESYTNPKILREIREPINIGRADTIKESMNLLVQDAHNAEMASHAAATANSARSAARGANVAAFFTAASFINDLRR